MALITAIAGAYTGAYTPNASAAGGGGGAGSIGVLADDGYRLAWTVHQQQIGNDGTDVFGQTLLAGIYRGGDWKLILRCREYAAANMNVAWPYVKVTGGGALSPVLAGIGREVTSSFAGSLVLTSTTGTPAATNPATLTAASCAAAPGNNSSLEFTSKLRELPIVLDLFPYSTSISAVTYYVWFVTT